METGECHTANHHVETRIADEDREWLFTFVQTMFWHRGPTLASRRDGCVYTLCADISTIDVISERL